jgi:MscS family membrane protein
LIVLALPVSLLAQPAAAPSTANLGSPRDTLKTLYFSVMAYDFRPGMIDDAINCLDLDDSQKKDPAEAARLAIELENILKELTLPLNAVPEAPYGDLCVVYDNDGCGISLSQKVGKWRFDRSTVARIPEMYRVALARHRDLQAERANLKENYTDPSATMKRFLMDCISADFYAASMALDLSSVSLDERAERGPVLAQQLAYVIQRRGWAFFQEIPNQPAGPAFTWHADRTGRIALERIRQSDSKDAWLFTKQTVKNVPAMYEAVKGLGPDPRWLALGVVFPPIAPDMANLEKAPPSVPSTLRSPRAMLKGFFRAMDEAEANDQRMAEALTFLDLTGIPQADRKVLGCKTATKLEAVLRKLEIDLSAIPDAWNAAPQVLGDTQNLRIDIQRQRDGCWRFTQPTIGRVPALFDKLAAQDRADRERSNQLDSARDTMATFLTAVNGHDYELAASCLDLGDIHPAARPEVGAVLAFKLKYIIDRIGRVYVQVIPDEADGPRYVWYRGDMGRIVIGRKSDGPRKGHWLFATDTVAQIEKMFRIVKDRQVSKSLENVDSLARPTLAEAPGVWLRFHLPEWAQQPVGHLGLYQWAGLALAALLGWGVSRLVLAQIHTVSGWMLCGGNSALTKGFVARKQHSLIWVVAWALFFRLLWFLDLPTGLLDALMPLSKLGLAMLVGWLGFQAIDLITAVCTNSEFLKPHRGLSDMVVPVTVHALKGGVVVAVLIYVVSQIGEGKSLGHFLTGLGVMGLTASLAAQDVMKSFFGTLMLISERSFKLGDRIIVGGQEGTVELVGFRSTRLRTADGTLVTVPNSTLASSAIDNKGARSFRPFRTSFLVGYGTSFDQLTAYRDQLQHWLEQHPGLEHDKVKVLVQKFTESGVEVGLELLMASEDSANDAHVQDEIHCEVLRLAQSLGIGLANSAGAAVGAPKSKALQAVWPA